MRRTRRDFIRVSTDRAALDLGAGYLVCQGTEAGGHVQATRGLRHWVSLEITAPNGKQDWRARRDSNSRPSGSKPDALSS